MVCAGAHTSAVNTAQKHKAFGRLSPLLAVSLGWLHVEARLKIQAVPSWGGAEELHGRLPEAPEAMLTTGRPPDAR